MARRSALPSSAKAASASSGAGSARVQASKAAVAERSCAPPATISVASSARSGTQICSVQASHCALTRTGTREAPAGSVTGTSTA
ncbi:hypothetical protein [Novosphingobium soli]|uniref:hypothetical protein n=1 Tax=Novosphingobium soli TaxID=574956 RepID=UPI00362AB870